MKQLIIIEIPEQHLLRTGRPLTLTFGNQSVDVAFEMNGSAPHPRKAGKASAKPRRQYTRTVPKSVRCRHPKCKDRKPFGSQSEYMIHRRADHDGNGH